MTTTLVIFPHVVTLSGNVCVLRLGRDVKDNIEEDPTGKSVLNLLIEGQPRAG